MPPSLVSPYTPRVGTQILLTDLHYALLGDFFIALFSYEPTWPQRLEEGV
ncbi:MAG: hypothetical protein ACRC5V_01065 [Aeromonas sp.]